MSEVLILMPDGDFHRFPGFRFSQDYVGAYLYRLDAKIWYLGVDFLNPDWMPVNDSDVPDNYKSRLQLILLLT